MKRPFHFYSRIKHIAILLLIIINFYSCSNTEKKEKITDLVNTFIGTDGHGHTYPGATMPFGMVQLSPDTRLEGWDGCSGYHYSDNVIYGFSHTHLSGTGVSDYGDILLMPTSGKIILNNGVDNKNGYSSKFKHENEIASPGFYSVVLDDYNIGVELTATKRVGFHKYTFSKSDESNIIIDLSHRDKVLESSIKFIHDNEIEGMRRSDAWANDQVIYFVARFSKSFNKKGISINDEIKNDINEAKGENLKAFVSFRTNNNEDILIKVGISSVSIEGARKNMEAEIHDWNFEKIKQNAENEWEQELKKIEIKGGTDEQKTTFYTALYHTMIAPNLFMDVDGQYRGRDKKIHKANDFENYTVFSLWDTYRAEHPLFTIIDKKRTCDFIKTFIKQYEQDSLLPVWELAGNETNCMIGYHAVSVIADAYIKGITGFDIEKAYEAMKNSAISNHHGLIYYKNKGYIPASEESESVSKTLEYAYDDWCIAQIARKLKKDDDYKYFIRRAQYYKNVFDISTGFMRAKMNETWLTPFDAKEVNFNYTEANAWQYSFYVPHDINSFIDLYGGKELFIEKLDEMFSSETKTTGREQADITGLIGQYAHGNEPSHHMAYLYNYVNQPWKTQERVKQIMDEMYSAKPDGLCGNEDCGQMSAWYVFSAMGFYPVLPGSNYYVIGTPLFEEVTINLENGNKFIIKANNISNENIYIQSSTLNGANYPKSFIRHSNIMDGGELIFEMGDKPGNTWGIIEFDIPHSTIFDNLISPVPFVKKGQKTFIDTTVIELSSITDSTKIYYTLNGTEPTEKSTLYTEPLLINKSTTIKAKAFREGLIPSIIIEANFNKIPKGRTIKLNTQYANQYSAGGNMALIDFVRGPLNFRTGAWQGYQEVDLNAVVDLGKMTPITKLSIGFIQDIGSWIFFPEFVEFYVSDDGKTFISVGKVKNNVSQNNYDIQIKDFSVNVYPKSVRYVKFVGGNPGICPDWHKGAGHKAWIFADEIIVE